MFRYLKIFSSQVRAEQFVQQLAEQGRKAEIRRVNTEYTVRWD